MKGIKLRMTFFRCYLGFLTFPKRIKDEFLKDS